MHATDDSAPATELDPARKPWTTLILLGLAQFMVVLDITVVNVALPSIGEDLSPATGSRRATGCAPPHPASDFASTRASLPRSAARGLCGSMWA